MDITELERFLEAEVCRPFEDLAALRTYFGEAHRSWQVPLLERIAEQASHLGAL
jgi:hypothetical protein